MSTALVHPDGFDDNLKPPLLRIVEPTRPVVVLEPTERTVERPVLPVGYQTGRGKVMKGMVEEFLASQVASDLAGKVQLIFTSPPFPLNRKKRYGNKQGEEYLEWLGELAPRLRQLLKPDGSLVMEVGNNWEPGRPAMSTLALEALLRFMRRGEFTLCQQFICYNPARLPNPIEWVNKQRIRVKDSFTHVWWLSPSDYPLASNRWVLSEYSGAMKKLLKSGKYNSGRRPSQNVIGATSFLTDNGGAIPPNVLTIANTRTNDAYQTYCKARNLPLHPARMPRELPEFFIKFLTRPKHLVLDPFGGSNTTGDVAEALKRRWLTIEPNADYIEGSKGRFADLITE